MPYRKSYRRKYKRRNYVRTSGESLALKAFRGVKALRGIINSEKKKHDAGVSETPSTSGAVTSLASIAQGDTLVQRNGNSILAKYLGIRYTVNMNASATNTILRTILVKDLQQVSDTAPTLGDVLQDVTVNSFLDYKFPGRFSVLMDKTIQLSANGRNGHMEKINIPLNTHIKYNGTASTDIQKNGLYLMFVSNESANVPTISGASRLHYYDN